MKFTRLALERFGHFADATLEFDPDARLHLVHGANEAGKSTALRAIGNFLFGIPERSKDGFRHANSTLCIAAELVARDGRVGSFRRRKARKDSLLDGAGNPCAEAALAGFLGGANGELFANLFGLNQASLRQGAAALRSAGGQVGASLFQAGTGLRDVRGLQKELDEEAAAQYGRGHSTAYRRARAEFDAARKALEAAAVRPDAWRHQREAQDAAAARLRELERDRLTAQEMRRKLERQLRTLPALRRLEQARAALAALGPVARLPDNAEAQRQSAIQAHGVALAKAQMARDALAALAQEAEAPAQTALLARAEDIRLLAERQARARTAHEDRPAQLHALAAAEAQLADLARELALPADPDHLLGRQPGAVARQTARKLIADHGSLLEKQRTRREQEEAARQALADIAAKQAELAEASEPVALASALEAVRHEGNIAAELARAARAHATAQTRLAEALASLVPWSGDEDALARAPVPAAETIARHEQSLRQLDAQREAARLALVDLDRQDEKCRLAMQAIAGGSAVPTEAALAEARAARDAALRLLGETGDGLAELAELVAVADQLADQRYARVAEVTSYERHAAERAALLPRRAEAATALQAAEDGCATAQAAWQAEWSLVLSGQPALPPSEMAAWRRRRDDILALRLASQECEAAWRTVQDRIEAACARLRAVVPAAADASLDTLRAQASAAHQEADRTHRAHLALAAEREKQQPALATAERAASAADAALASWQLDWQAAMQALSLPETTSPAGADAALALWAAIAIAGEKRAAAARRLAEMTEAVADFAAAAAALLAQLAPDLVAQDPLAAVPQLAARLAAEQEAERLRARREKERGTRQAELDKATQQLQAAEAILAGLRALAGVADDAGLVAAIERARDHAALTKQAAEAESLALQQGDGHDLAFLLAECAAAELESLRAGLDVQDRELAAIDDLRDMQTNILAAARAALATLEAGTDAAHQAQLMRDAAAELGRAAREYLRLRVAARLLACGIEQYRLRQQGPLLARASAHFAALTDGRYRQLLAEEEDGAMVFRALPASGPEIGIEALSEGTADQLYLALRIAAVEQYAATAEPLPFIADDLLVNFDEARSHAAIRVLAELGATTQTLLFTHHAHIAELAEAEPGVQVLRLD